jgi:hypothetical protein
MHLLCPLCLLLFCMEANDFAVSLASMKDIPGPWTEDYDVRPVTCDHMSYFKRKLELAELAKVLGPVA